MSHAARQVPSWLIFDVRRKMKRCVKVGDLTSTGGLAFDVIDFVSLLGERALQSEWTGSSVWTVQEGDDGHFEELCESGRRIPGIEFADALKKVVQVIDGRFEAFDDGNAEPWVIIEAIDSSYFLLHAEEDVLASARARFHSVSDYPHEKTAYQAPEPTRPLVMPRALSVIWKEASDRFFVFQHESRPVGVWLVFDVG